MDLGSRRDDQQVHSNRIDPSRLLERLGIDNYHIEGLTVYLSEVDLRKVAESAGMHVSPMMIVCGVYGWEWEAED